MREKQHHKILSEETAKVYELGKQDGRIEILLEIFKTFRFDEYVLEAIKAHEQEYHSDTNSDDSKDS